MKLKVWLLTALAPLTAMSILAQASNPVPPAVIEAAPPTAAAVEPAAPAKPAKTPKKKKAKAKAKTTKAAAPATNNIVYNPPVSATVKCEVLDVRGQGSFVGEVIGHVKKGDTVAVLEETTLGHPHADEPAHWSRIVMPTNVPVWVDGAYLDAGKAVKAKKLNMRGGPGENYSVLGSLDKGTVVVEVRKKAGWLEIETPTNAFGFVASHYLEKGAEMPAPAPAPVAVTPPPAPEPPVVVNVPTEPAPVKPAETAPVAPAPTPAAQSEQELAALRAATAPVPAAPQPEATKPEGPRIVTREGFVHRCYNITGPADFEMHDIKTGELIEYLQPAPGQKFKPYVGTRVRITGAESLDPRWPRTPILLVQTVDLMP